MEEKDRQSLKRLTQERFQEEVAQELGINPVRPGLTHREAPNLEAEVAADDEILPET